MALKKRGGVKPTKPSPTPTRKKATVKSSSKTTTVSKTTKTQTKSGTKSGASLKDKEKAKKARVSYKNEYVKLLEQTNKLLKKEVKTIQKKIESVEEVQPIQKTAAQIRDERRAAKQTPIQVPASGEEFYVPKPKSITAVQAWEIVKDIRNQLRAREFMLEELLNASINR